MRATFRPPTAEDIETVGRNMREIDQIECVEMTGLFPLQALREAVRDSVFCLAALVDGKAVCVFGCAPEAPLLGHIGIPWLLGVEGFEEHSREILRHSRRFVLEMARKYPHLRNVVHTDNSHAIRWLKWCGFSIGDELPVGRSGARFRLFELRAG